MNMNVARSIGMITLLLLVVVCALGSCVPTAPAMAGDFHQRHPYFQPVQQVFYFVGAPLRAEAIVEKQKHADPEWQEFQQFKAWKKYMAEQATVSQSPLPPQPLPQETEPASYIVQACARCHSGSTPKAGLLLDNPESIASISAETRIVAMRRVLDGSMPPQSSLSPETKGDLIQELLQGDAK